MFEQVKLQFEMNGLEPHIDQLTMETHYGKHHAAYTKMFNELAEKAGVADNWFYYKFTKAGKYTIKVRMGCQSSSETPAIVETLTIV